MDVLIQQDGRIQTNIAIPPSVGFYFKTAEFHGGPHFYKIESDHQIPDFRDRVTERTFRKLGVVGYITVWVEVR